VTDGGVNAEGIVAGDFDNDGNVDLAVGSSSGDSSRASTSVTILYGRGDGTFEAPLAVGSSYGSIGVAAADFNGDGWLDRAATEFYGSAGNGHFYAATILLNDGCGP